MESQCVSLHFEYKLVYTKRLRDVTTHSLYMEPGLLNDAKMREEVKH